MIFSIINYFIWMLSFLQNAIILSMTLAGLFVVITRLRFVTFLLTRVIVFITFLTSILSFTPVIVCVDAILLVTKLFFHTFSCMSWRPVVSGMRDS